MQEVFLQQTQRAQQHVKIHEVIQKNLIVYFNILVQDNNFPYNLKIGESVPISIFTKMSTT